MDVSEFIKAKSDQLNADDLIGGPITVRIEGVSKGNADQPVVIKISGGHQPWKPCKTTLRVLVAAMGADTTKWVGTWAQLFRDEHVKWAGVEVGGIRIKALSSIDQRTTLSLTETRGRKIQHTVEPLQSPKDGGSTAKLTHDQAKTLAEMLAAIGDEDLEGTILEWAKADCIESIDASRYEVIREKLATRMATSPTAAPPEVETSPEGPDGGAEGAGGAALPPLIVEAIAKRAQKMPKPDVAELALEAMASELLETGTPEASVLVKIGNAKVDGKGNVR